MSRSSSSSSSASSSHVVNALFKFMETAPPSTKSLKASQHYVVKAVDDYIDAGWGFEMKQFKLVGSVAQKSDWLRKDVLPRVVKMLNDNDFLEGKIGPVLFSVFEATKTGKEEAIKKNWTDKENCVLIAAIKKILHELQLKVEAGKVKGNFAEFDIPTQTVIVNSNWVKHAYFLRAEKVKKGAQESLSEEYDRHVATGVIKIIHEIIHACTESFLTIEHLVFKQIKPKSKRSQLDTETVGDMGYAFEESYLGGRLFRGPDPDSGEMAKDSWEMPSLETERKKGKKGRMSRRYSIADEDDFVEKVKEGDFNDISPDDLEGDERKIAKPKKGKKRKYSRRDEDDSSDDESDREPGHYPTGNPIRKS